MKRTTQQRHGFTLLELLVVVAIAGVLLAAGLPSLQGMVMQQKVAGAADAFYRGATLARAHAVRRNEDAIMTPLVEGDWAQGWQVHIGAELMQSQPSLPAGVSVRTGNCGQRMEYLATGQIRQNCTWHFDVTGHAREVIISRTGRPRICNPATGPCN